MFSLDAKFKIETDTILTLEYNEFLYTLYLPLIEAESVFLYNFLANLVRTNDNETNYEELLKKSTLNRIDFEKSLSILESVGLIRKFEDKENGNYLLLVQGIYTPKHFFNNDVFKGLLVDRIGEEEVNKIIDRYKIYEIDGSYVETSDSIDKNFKIDFSIDNLAVGKGKRLVSVNKGSIKSNFDEIKFLKALKKIIPGIKDDALSEGELKLIGQWGTVFGVKEDVLADFVSRNIDMLAKKGSKLKQTQLKNSLLIHLNSMQDYSKIKAGVKTKLSKLSSNSDLAKRINYYESVTPYDFLKKRQNDRPVASADANIIDLLATRYMFSNPIINAILDYTLTQNNEKLSKDYVTKIASSLARKNVETAVEAVDALYERKDYEDTPSVTIEKQNTSKRSIISEDIDDEENENPWIS